MVQFTYRSNARGSTGMLKFHYMESVLFCFYLELSDTWNEIEFTQSQSNKINTVLKPTNNFSFFFLLQKRLLGFFFKAFF